MSEPITLYGMPHSLYTGKARSYLRKQNIAYIEQPPGHPRFAEVILPAIRRGIIPVIETADGQIVQDTVDIIDHFEKLGAALPAYPQHPRQLAIAHLFELYSVLGLTRHAMHYRWSYLDQQDAFLTDAFSAGTDTARARATMDKMHSYLPILGVSEESIPQIEASYRELLAGLNAHFARFPYILGYQPSIADYSLFGPMFAHLGRDPVPLAIMQREAPKVFRWTERMHAPGLDMVEYGRTASGFLTGDQVPETLTPILDQIAREIVPTLADQLPVMEAHVASGAVRSGAPVTEKPHQRVIGFADTSFRGIPHKSGVQPYTFFLWQRLIDAVGAEQEARDLFSAHGLSAIIEGRLPIRIERKDNIEVWGAIPA